MKIEVLHNYGGKITNDLRILPGVYDATDERVFGIADYLVANGHAVVVEADPEPTVVEDEKPVEPVVVEEETAETDAVEADESAVENVAEVEDKPKSKRNR